MKLLFDCLPMFLVLTCLACATVHPTTDAAGGRPDNFSIEYEWQEGSLPPPNHYEYTITITPDGQGAVVMIPDYPSMTAVKWTEHFTVKAEELDGLDQVMKANGLFTREWRTPDPPRVGGSRRSLTVTTGGRRAAIRTPVVSEQESAVGAMCAAVEALVPKATWDTLNARRRQYVQEQRGR